MNERSGSGAQWVSPGSTPADAGQADSDQPADEPANANQDITELDPANVDPDGTDVELLRPDERTREERKTSTSTRDTTIGLSIFAILAIAAACWLNLRAYRDNFEFYTDSGLPLRHKIGAAGAVAYLAVLFVLVHSVRRFRYLFLSYVTAVGMWACAVATLSVSQAAAPNSPREWLSTTWYWTLEPLPVDIAGPSEWIPPVTNLPARAWVAIVGLQVYTVLLVLAGAGLVLARVRQGREQARRDLARAT